MGKRVRTWNKKTQEPKPFSSLKVDQAFHLSWDKKQAEAAKRKQVKELENEMKAESVKEIEERKERRRKNLKRKQSNIQKSSVVQQITNSKKLKKLNKKQRQKLVMLTTY